MGPVIFSPLMLGVMAAVSLSGSGPVRSTLHATFDQLLKGHIMEGVVDYAGFKKDEAVLDAYLTILSRTDPADLNRDERLAFWINAYNAFTVKLILRKYPEIKSIKDIPVRWELKEWRVGGRLYSLDGMEHQILRKEFQEPRIHFAIVCASKSCPDLASEAYQPDRLDAQLTAATKRFLSNPLKGFLAKQEAGWFGGIGFRVYLSPIFKWFEEDFTRKGRTVIEWITPYLSEEDQEFINVHQKDLSISHLSYDWSLNGR